MILEAWHTPHLARGWVCLMLVSGCTNHLASVEHKEDHRRATGDAATYDPSIAFLKLSEIKPLPLLAPAGTEQRSTSARADRQIKQAEGLFGEARFAEAMQHLERALRYSPNSLQAHVLMTEVCLEAGNHARAREHARRATELSPRSPAAHYWLGRTLAAQHNWREALNELRLSLIAEGLPVEAERRALIHYELARSLDALGFLTAGIDQYRKFIKAAKRKTDSDAPPQRWQDQDRLTSAYLAQANIHERLGHPLRAARALQEVCAVEGADPTHIRRLAQLYVQADRLDEAIQTAKQLVKLDPEHLDLLVSIRRNAGQGAVLIRDLEELSSAGLDSFALAGSLAGEYQRQGKHSAAIQRLRQFVTRHPDHIEGCVSLAGLLTDQKRYINALTVLAQTIEAGPTPSRVAEVWLAQLGERSQKEALWEHVSSHLRQPDLTGPVAYLIGCLALELNRLELAEEAFQRSLGLDPEFRDSFLELGQLHARRYRWQQAIRAAQQVLELDPDSARAFRLLGQAHLGLDQFEQAATALNNCMRLDRTDIKAAELLAEKYERSGKPLQAQRQHRIVLEMDPNHAEAAEKLFFRAVHEQKPERIETNLKRLENLSTERARFLRCQAFLQASRSGDWQEYADTLLQILQRHPDDVPTRLGLAVYHAETHQLEPLAGQLSMVLKREPENETALYMRSTLATRELRYDSALGDLQLLLSRYPNRRAYQRALVDNLTHAQRYREAADALQAHLANPNLPEEARARFRYDLMMCFALDDSVEEAMRSLQQWLATTPDSGALRATTLDLFRLDRKSQQALTFAEQWYADGGGATRNLLIEACWGAQRFQDAHTLILAWLDANPDDPNAVAALIGSFEKADQLLDAIELAKVASLDPSGRLPFEWQLINVYINDKQYQAAVRLLRNQLAEADARRDPFRPASQHNRRSIQERLCRTLTMAGRFDEAQRELEAWQNSERDPAIQAEILRLMGLCAQLSGKHNLAMQQMEKLLSQMPNDPGINNDLGYTWANRGLHLDRAERMIVKALGEDPRSAAFLDSLGWVLYKKGDFAGAAQWLGRAARCPMGGWYGWLRSQDHKRGRDDPVIQDHRGDTAWRLRRSAEALEHWQQALELAEQDDATPLSDEVKSLRQRAPAKIEAARSGEPPPVAAAATDTEEKPKTQNPKPK